PPALLCCCRVVVTPRLHPFPTRRSSDLLARCCTRAIPRRRGGRLRVSRGLDLAEAALRASGGDDVEVVVHAERSGVARRRPPRRSEEHTSELQSRVDLVCRLLLENKKES